MKDFFLSDNTNFPFKLFGIQHILMLIVTFLLLFLIYMFRKKITFLDNKLIKKIRIFMGIILLLNMFIYRGSYIYYGVYDIKIHLSLYYCHIVNYLFVFSLFLNYKPLYKIIYGLSWLGTVWTIFFPDVSGGIDCFIFYSSFISHNLLIVFTTFIIVAKKIKFKFIDCFKSIICAIGIMLFTYCINYDFGTNFNDPRSILKSYAFFSRYQRYIVLIGLGFVGSLFAKIINYFCVDSKQRSSQYEKN